MTAKAPSFTLLSLAIVGSVVIPILLMAVMGWASWTRVSTTMDERLTASLAVMHQHALKVFSAAEFVISEIDEIVAARDDDSLRRDPSVHRRLRQVTEKLTNLQSLWIVDSKGRPLATDVVFPAPTFDLRDRDYFQALESTTLPLHIGQVYRPRITTNAPFFSITGRRAGQSFNGVINVSLLPTDFERLYEEFGSASGMHFMMVRDDGAVLAGFPERVGGGRKVALARQDTEFGSRLSEGRTSGVVSGSAVAGATAFRTAWRRLGPYPVYLMAWVQADTVWQEWRAAVGGTLLFGVPASIALCLTLLMARRGTVLFYDEVNRRRAVEDALRQAQRMEVTGQLTGGVAHDFNNLLAVILGNLSLVAKRADLLPEDRRLLEAALQAGQRGATLTQRLLAFARKQDLAARPVDVGDLLASMSDLLSRSVGAGTRLQIEPPETPCVALVDPNQLELAILNLVLNARDATSPDGRIEISVTGRSVSKSSGMDLRPGEYVVVTVTDDGRGMDLDTLTKAAEPFFTTKEVGKGTGLGLSMVQGFALQSGGKLKLDSAPGRGTTAEIFLPATDEKPKPLRPTAPVVPQEKRMGVGLKVLVVVDDPLVLMGTAAMVEDLGHEVLSAGSALRAIEIMRSTHADVVLTDYTMPGMTGSQLAAQLRLIKPGIPVVLATGHADVPPGDGGGPLQRLTKPYTLDALASALNKAVE